VTNTVIIICAGIAEPAAGSCTEMKGRRSLIFELHDFSGGFCTAWERNGYLIDGSCYALRRTAV
jgi:hypothetical protein